MRNTIFKRGFVLAIAGAMSIIACAGCGSVERGSEVIIDANVPLVASAASPEQMALAKELSENGQVFSEGVYAVYDADDEKPEKTTFYIIYDDETGYIEDVKAYAGTYFEYRQEEYCIKFYFGFGDPYVKEFKVLSMKDGVVTGTFDDENTIVFEPIANADPHTFNVDDYKANSFLFDAPSHRPITKRHSRRKARSATFFVQLFICRA